MYYTYVSINKKYVRVTETDKEHEERMSRIRKAQYAQKMREQEKSSGTSPYAQIICPGCKSLKPLNNITRTGDWCCKHCGYAPNSYKGGPRI